MATMRTKCTTRTKWGTTGAALLLLMLPLAACTDTAEPTVTEYPVPTGIFSGPPAVEPLRDSAVALVTDFGNCDEGEQEVADLVNAWQPDAIVTAGDNTQSVEGCEPYAESVYAYYGAWLNRANGPQFFPVLGNHDYTNEGAGLDAYVRAFPYLSAADDAQRRWYERRIGDIHFFMLDSEVDDDDRGRQQEWLRSALATAAMSADGAAWRVVVFHRPPFSSGVHGPEPRMQPEAGWDYSGWGADLVISGHQHIYEDVIVDGLHYLTAGVGASGIVRSCPESSGRTEGSRACLEGVGAVLLRATPDTLVVEYHQPKDGADVVSDAFTVAK